MKTSIILGIILLVTTASCLPMSEYDSDSLKPVISMIEKRERELEPLYVYEKEPEEEIIFVPEEYGQPEDIGYGYQRSALSSELANFKEHYPYLSNQELEKLMLDYLEKGRPKDNYYIYGKTKKSVFRERDESEYPEKLQQVSNENDEDGDDRERGGYSENYNYKNQSPFRERFRETESKGNNRHINNADLEYLSALNTLWEQYQQKQDGDAEADDSNDIDRNDNIVLSDDDIAEILSYFDEDNRPMEETYDDSYPVVVLNKDKHSKHHSKSPQKRIWRDGAFDSYPGYDKGEKFLIKKRSLKNILHDDLKRKKKATDSKQKDASTDKELNKIFGVGEKKNNTNKKLKTDKPIEVSSTVAHTPAKVTTEKPIVVKKKSIDWSNYFGIDKRKKKSYKKRGTDDWLVEQYMNQNEAPKEMYAKDIDNKFRDMEDMILDQVIKYTGAHEGIRNPEQLHRIKQKIMAQLAAAYNLEKMRRTLDVYKSSVDVHNNESRYPQKRVAIKKEMVQPKDTGVTLEESNDIAENSQHPQHTKKSFFRRNNPQYANGFSV